MKPFEYIGELEFARLNGHEKFAGSGSGHGLSRTQRLHRAGRRVKAKHVDNLFRLVVLGPAKHVGFGAISVRELVDHRLIMQNVSMIRLDRQDRYHGAEGDEPDQCIRRKEAEADDEGFS